MNHFPAFTSNVIPLLVNDIDTDQIIPARFLKVTDKNGLGASLFSDWRYNEDGTPKPDFVLNRPEYKGAAVLLAGDNFGCGSSREHAPWALAGSGIKSVISTSFADIFRNNALKNGIVPVIVPAVVHEELSRLARENSPFEVTIDLESQTLRYPIGKTTQFPIDGFSKTCILEGTD
ncbi:MAG TPA: 3-isopropylmalate dehydratase small subunit, partial [Bacteroidota bacterium]|nr:3-isopropylmalate dehydratase small subunit [Bacteroidota bacterium]